MLRLFACLPAEKVVSVCCEPFLAETLNDIVVVPSILARETASCIGCAFLMAKACQLYNPGSMLCASNLHRSCPALNLQPVF